ncbi:YdcF family protein [Thermotoga sp. KOL6]|uniref:YdcF family protein n=1 Tax=Thermotoga sp. KOL6 TaxID=126741 RepID=UPI001E31A416|nr:YdcF family protein [Thermotoga sp. KOL6]
MLQKIIGSFLIPPGILILFLVFGAFLLKRKKWFYLVLAVLLYLLSSYPGEFFLLRPLEKNLTFSTLPRNAVIVVLGGGVERGTRLGDSLKDSTLRRLMAGFQIHKETGFPVLLSGGGFSQIKPEAVVMKEYLLSLGVSEKDILVESRSKNTYENAIFTKEILGGDTPIILVTDSIHMRRALFTFKRFFKTVVPYPAGCYFGTPEFIDFFPNSTSFYLNSRAVYEWIGILWYNLKGR